MSMINCSECKFGVIGEEEGTKPRKILMSMKEFEEKKVRNHILI